MKWSTYGSNVVSSLKADGVYDDGIHQIVISTITTQGMKKTSCFAAAAILGNRPIFHNYVNNIERWSN
jgi:hypothetical protein